MRSLFIDVPPYAVTLGPVRSESTRADTVHSATPHENSPPRGGEFSWGVAECTVSALVLSLRTGPKVTAYGGTSMNKDRIEGNWLQVKGKVKEKWGKLTDDDLDVIAGHRDQLEGKIQERYGIAKDQVRKDIDDWFGAQKW